MVENHRCVVREERGVERGRFVATPGTVKVARCDSACVSVHFLAPLQVAGVSPVSRLLDAQVLILRL